MRLLAIGVGTVLAFGASEAGLRLAEIGMPHLYSPDYYCGSRLRPSTEGVWTREGHGNVSINAHGFRGPELSTTKEPHIFRVATLGDSYMEALQVDENRSFCSLLRNFLNSKTNLPHRTCEVVNCGVSGYGTAQQLQMLRHHVLPLAPDAVLLAIYPENDIRNNLRSLELDPARPYFMVDADGELSLDTSFRISTRFLMASSWYERQKADLINRSRVLQLLHYVKNTSLGGHAQIRAPGSMEDALHASVQDSLYVYSHPTDHEHRQAWRITKRLIQELAKECNGEHIPFIVFTVSSPVQVYPDHALRRRVEIRCNVENLFYSERRIQAICLQSGIKFFPLASRMQTVADESGEFFHGFSNTSLGLGHWNESGHLTAARILYNWLSRDGTFMSRKGR